MNTYHKIQTMYKRESEGKHNLLIGEWSLPVFDYLQNNEWAWSEKFDGTNLRLYKDGTIKGKTDRAEIPGFLLSAVKEKLDKSLDKLAEIFDQTDQVCIYAEGIGRKIQKVGSKYIPDGNDFVVFDIKVGDVWLRRDSVEDICAKLGWHIVPIVGKGNLHELEEFVKAGFNSTWGDFLAEGVVARPSIELMVKGPGGYNRVITKLKYKDFNFLRQK